MPRGSDRTRFAPSAAGGAGGGSGAPRWDAAPIYPGFDSPAYREDRDRLAALTDELVRTAGEAPPAGAAAETVTEWLRAFIRRYERCADLFETLIAYAYSTFSTDTRSTEASGELNRLEEMALPIRRAEVSFRNGLARHREIAAAAPDRIPALEPYRLFLSEQLLLQEKQLSPAEEDLAADLSRAGGDAWGRLQEAVSSTLTAVWDEATGERRTVIQLRSMAFDPDRAVREKAFRKEIAAWKQVEVPMAYSLNGVKGFADILNGRRGWESTLDRSIVQSRLSRKALDALIGSMRDSLPRFRRYLTAKAKLLGVPRLAFFDLFAPVGNASGTWSFEKARDFIIDRFAAFSGDLGQFAERAFRERWIDAEPREGKVGGAYCIDFPDRKVSRILCNFDGSFSSVSTIAHELGHAYHHHVLTDVPHIQRAYPMTLAETASIFSENIVFSGAVENAGGDERLPLLESFLSDANQVIVDILSRFIFEQGVMEQRRSRELSSEELCARMIEAQKETYGDALDPAELHPYMWAVKGHYYRQDLAFYNFPYAFGLLFGLGLFARYRKEGPAFAETYRDILRRTGIASAVDVTREAGFDIEERQFWQSGLDYIGEQIDSFTELAAGRDSGGNITT